MTRKPDYTTLRDKKGFSWYVGTSQDALRGITGISIKDFNLRPEACIEAHQLGRVRLREMFGNEVQIAGVSTPAISYGHVNGLGSELLFPEGGEVGHTHIYKSLDEGIGALRKPVDFLSAGMAPFYLKFRESMKAAFPGESVGFGYGLEGPITTAWELRGEDFFIDIFDNPSGMREFLATTTESILCFHRFRCRVLGTPEIDPKRSGMADDIASMVPPDLWDELVIPYWDLYYRGTTTGERHAHVEDLRPIQVKYLEKIGLEFYDPSISPHVNQEIVFKECRVPFSWRLPSFHYDAMTHEDVRNFVFSTAAQGASSVTTWVEANMCNEQAALKVKCFIQAAKEVKDLIDRGNSREEIGNRISVTTGA
ncbi:MAG: hypothetical protein A2268_06240 [Candidatus Raymondbacteria bacterium RifOxyA12_full_50_37]|uniref:Uroporphyrinogen decarboxylase (URO-D) domain-containing protein n=1 Tax=Candidatus Raymondbacteria bacterium RIFOXYD12_FULL_49_13 TaxID=1817890 RepID=A0A1F7FK00_UNCRA|nr:MAG: hypothetical protein A2268_06240 [Candidatus Raymondbacteria bacterium RifOxyA12_full_50_37]OGJ94568.1 MAG: hypothetical protein A2248_15170 [Candidatus Raymondbacteria bacterium RIFOXYA2_FULL_49_16]OGK01717.1 MAG: hypothetical protein A2350_10900 [Candidatus Raymondbacteria bacterium RifOxyB12_full_50_8]OGK05666.1 MAG: hypothetical protein A2487_14260 [Candidatus Raymondbacteria bacterium RifOxyC12_full_50_8]OGK07044.1 MAG: hypothetical protein A2519_13810 [Candidatus Raymondbacteria b